MKHIRRIFRKIVLLRIKKRASMERVQLKNMRRSLRDVSDPFGETTNTEFEKLYGLNKQICKILIDLIRPHLSQRSRIHGLSSTVRVLCALRFLTIGCFQRPVGQDFSIAMSQASVSRCLDEVCQIIESKLSKNYMNFTLDAEEIAVAKEQFFNLHRFPGVIGLVGATHVAIKKPNNNIEQVYYASRKVIYTKNVQIVCDANLKILNVNARYGGSAHKSFVWNNSIVKQKMMKNYENGDKNTFLLGDSGYGEQPYLMTPYIMPKTPQEKAYNSAHEKTRHLVEKCIGVLRTRFRCLSKKRTLMYSPEKASLIVNCCVTIHNIMTLHGIPLPPEEDILSEMDTDADKDDRSETIFDSASIRSIGKAIRDELAVSFI